MNIIKRKDLIGTTIGRLLVLGIDPKNPRRMVCLCSCGKMTSVQYGNLTRGNPTKSCGCLRRELGRLHTAEEFLSKTRHNREMSKKYQTNFNIIGNEKPPAHNTSGVKGVSWNAHTQKWIAYINAQGRRYSLGSHTKFIDAVAARAEAEREYFAPLLAARAEEERSK